MGVDATNAGSSEYLRRQQEEERKRRVQESLAQRFQEANRGLTQEARVETQLKIPKQEPNFGDPRLRENLQAKSKPETENDKPNFERGLELAQAPPLVKEQYVNGARAKIEIALKQNQEQLEGTKTNAIVPDFLQRKNSALLKLSPEGNSGQITKEDQSRVDLMKQRSELLAAQAALDKFAQNGDYESIGTLFNSRGAVDHVALQASEYNRLTAVPPELEKLQKTNPQEFAKQYREVLGQRLKAEQAKMQDALSVQKQSPKNSKAQDVQLEAVALAQTMSKPMTQAFNQHDKLTELLDQGKYAEAQKLINGNGDPLMVRGFDAYNTPKQDAQYLADRKLSLSAEEGMKENQAQREGLSKELDQLDVSTQTDSEAYLKRSADLEKQIGQAEKTFKATAQYEDPPEARSANQIPKRNPEYAREKDKLEKLKTEKTELDTKYDQVLKKQETERLGLIEKQRGLAIRQEAANDLLEQSNSDAARRVLNGETVETKADIKVGFKAESNPEYEKLSAEEKTAREYRDGLGTLTEIGKQNIKALQAQAVDLQGQINDPSISQEERQKLIQTQTQTAIQIEKSARDLDQVMQLQAHVTDLVESGDYAAVRDLKEGKTAFSASQKYNNDKLVSDVLEREAKFTAAEAKIDAERLLELSSGIKERANKLSETFDKHSNDSIKEMKKIDAGPLSIFDAHLTQQLAETAGKEGDAAGKLKSISSQISSAQDEAKELLAAGKVHEARKLIKSSLEDALDTKKKVVDSTNKHYTDTRGKTEEAINGTFQTIKQTGVGVVAATVTIATAGAGSGVALAFLAGTGSGTALGYGTDVADAKFDNKTWADAFNSANAGIGANAQTAAVSSFSALLGYGAGNAAKSALAGETLAPLMSKFSPAAQNLITTLSSGSVSGAASAAPGVVQGISGKLAERDALVQSLKTGNPELSQAEINAELVKKGLDNKSIARSAVIGLGSGAVSGMVGARSQALSEGMSKLRQKALVSAAEELVNFGVAAIETASDTNSPVGSRQFNESLMNNFGQAFASKLAGESAGSGKTKIKVADETSAAVKAASGPGSKLGKPESSVLEPVQPKNRVNDESANRGQESTENEISPRSKTDDPATKTNNQQAAEAEATKLQNLAKEVQEAQADLEAAQVSREKAEKLSPEELGKMLLQEDIGSRTMQGVRTKNPDAEITDAEARKIGPDPNSSRSRALLREKIETARAEEAKAQEALEQAKRVFGTRLEASTGSTNSIDREVKRWAEASVELELTKRVKLERLEPKLNEALSKQDPELFREIYRRKQAGQDALAAELKTKFDALKEQSSDTVDFDSKLKELESQLDSLRELKELNGLDSLTRYLPKQEQPSVVTPKNDSLEETQQALSEVTRLKEKAETQIEEDPAFFTTKAEKIKEILEKSSDDSVTKIQKIKELHEKYVNDRTAKELNKLTDLETAYRTKIEYLDLYKGLSADDPVKIAVDKIAADQGIIDPSEVAKLAYKLDHLRNKAPEKTSKAEVDKFIADLQKLSAVPGAASLIDLAERGVGHAGPNSIRGAFAEAERAVAFLKKGMSLRIAANYIEGKATLIKLDGTGLLDGTVTGDALKSLLKDNGLKTEKTSTKVPGPDGKLIEVYALSMSNDGDKSYLDYNRGILVDKDGNPVVMATKNNARGQITLTPPDLDLIIEGNIQDASGRQTASGITYIEQKLHAETFILKDFKKTESGYTKTNPKETTQLERLMMNAKAHDADNAAVMFDTKSMDEGGRQRAQIAKMLAEIKQNYGSDKGYPPLRILDAKGIDITEQFEVQ